MKLKLSLMLLGLSLAFTALGAERPSNKGVVREQATVTREVISPQGVIAWSGVVVIEETADALIVSPGESMRPNVQAISFRFDAETVAEREDDPDLAELSGQATVTYDLSSRTWSVQVEDDATGEVIDWQIVHPGFNDVAEETVYRRAVMDFYTYLMSEEEVTVTAGGANITWTGCPVGKHCCTAGTGPGTVVAICDNGATPTCVCTTNSNGTACSAKCVFVAV